MDEGLGLRNEFEEFSCIFFPTDKNQFILSASVLILSNFHHPKSTYASQYFVYIFLLFRTIFYSQPGFHLKFVLIGQTERSCSNPSFTVNYVLKKKNNVLLCYCRFSRSEKSSLCRPYTVFSMMIKWQFFDQVFPNYCVTISPDI